MIFIFYQRKKAAFNCGLFLKCKYSFFLWRNELISGVLDDNSFPLVDDSLWQREENKFGFCRR